MSSDAPGPGEPDSGEPGPPAGGMASLADEEAFPTSDLVTKELLVDSGLPSLVFVTVYTISGRLLTPALIAALASGVVLAGLRLARRESLQHVLTGYIGLGIAVFLAARTGRAETFFLPGLLINAGYLAAYVVSIMVRWPLLGVLVGLATGEGTAWRQSPHLLKAYTVASWFWVAMFGLRLGVQLPLYLTGSVVALGVARVVMGWPLFLLCLYLSWVVIRRARQLETTNAD